MNKVNVADSFSLISGPITVEARDLFVETEHAYERGFLISKKLYNVSLYWNLRSVSMKQYHEFLKEKKAVICGFEGLALLRGLELPINLYIYSFEKEGSKRAPFLQRMELGRTYIPYYDCSSANEISLMPQTRLFLVVEEV